MSAIALNSTPSVGWLRDRPFDAAFLLGLPLLALASGAVVMLDRRLLVPVLFADLWLLGYHHVIATFTRLCFDARSLDRYRFLVFVLPLIVAVACLGAVAAAGDLWVLVSMYFYWQWFHYARQSWGVAQSYRRKIDGAPAPSAFDAAAFYAVPVVGVLLRSAQSPETFLMLPIRMIPMSEPLAEAAAAVAVAVAVAWWGRALLDYRSGRLSAPYLVYLASHHAIFAAAYLCIRDVTIGWLVINIWHNGQYVLFVWLFNNRRFAAGPSPKARLLSWLSQDGRLGWYLGFCLALSTAVYGAIANVLPLVTVMPVFILYQVINFHHYVVDAVIWRREHVRTAMQSI
jgi:hypothetical protein